MLNFEFERAESVESAARALETDPDAKLLAGGQSLIPVLKMEFAEPSRLVSLGSIDGLKEIKREGDSLSIGAMATHADVEHSEVVREMIPSLADLAHGIGDAQVRNRGTLGGAIAHADPAADYPAAIVGYRTQIKTHRRTIAGDDFFTGLFETALESGELITAVNFAPPKAAVYAKFANPASKYAIVGVLVAQYPDEVRVGVTGAKATAFRWSALEQRLSSSLSAEGVDSAEMDDDDFMADLDADEDYRRALLRVMAKRAIRSLG